MTEYFDKSNSLLFTLEPGHCGKWRHVTIYGLYLVITRFPAASYCVDTVWISWRWE